MRVEFHGNIMGSFSRLLCKSAHSLHKGYLFDPQFRLPEPLGFQRLSQNLYCEFGDDDDDDDDQIVMNSYFLTLEFMNPDDKYAATGTGASQWCDGKQRFRR